MSQKKEYRSNESQNNEELLVAYTELCNSYNAIREFRASLLGLLPLASAGGFYLMLSSSALGPLTFFTMGVLGCSITFGLYLYERHNMDKCHSLINIGADLENNVFQMKNGQFTMRIDNSQGDITGKSRYQLATTLIYGAVFLGWLYLILAGILQIFGGTAIWV